MIEFINATKKYGDKIALNNLNLKINEGEIFGLIGHNGAGKSTTIKSLVGILDLTSGNIKFDNMDMKEDSLNIKKNIGYVSDSPDAFLKMSAKSYWNFIGLIYGLTTKEIEEKVASLSAIFDFTEETNSYIESMSHGMRQKVFVIGALLSNPKVWVLDEPMTGLDPKASYELKNLMKKHRDNGNIVLFSTHVLEVAEKLCDRIGIINKGNLIYLGTVEDLKKTYSDLTLEDIYINLINNGVSNAKKR